MKMNSCEFYIGIIFYILIIGSSSGIKNTVDNNTEITGRQSKAISFFPNEDPNNFGHSSNFIESSQNHRQNDEDQLKFSNDQRHDNVFLNQDELMVSPKQQQQPNFQQQPSYYAPQQPQQQNYASPQQNYQFVRPQSQYQPQLQPQPQSPNPNQFVGNYQNYYNRPQRPPIPQSAYYHPGSVRPVQPVTNNPFYNQNYANQYDYNGPGGFQDPNQSQNPIANFFNNLQQGQLGGAGGQFSKALEDISRFDDYQCVPKLLCQMIGTQRRPGSSRPGFLNGQTLTALIAAVPSNSPALNFGRAALLGYSSGEYGCDVAYPKCPRNEDDLLDYLNNHRGGFFRFFNGGASFGDVDDYEEDYQQNYQAPQNNRPQTQQTQPQQQQSAAQSAIANKYQMKYPLYSQQNYPQDFPQYQQNNQNTQNQQQSSYTNLATLQNIAEAINSGGGINLSNLGQNFGLISSLAQLMGAGGNNGVSNKNPNQKRRPPPKPVADDDDDDDGTSSGSGVGEFVSNLLTGLVGNRFSSRRITKRSVDSPQRDSENEEIRRFLLSLINQQKPKKKKKGASRKRNLNVELADPDEPYSTVKSSNLDKTLLKLLELTVNSPAGTDKTTTTTTTENDENLQPRIINFNQPINSIDTNSITKFFPSDLVQQAPNTRRPKEINPTQEFFPHDQQQSPVTSHENGALSFQNIFRFPSGSDSFSPAGHRNTKSIKFVSPQQTTIQFQDDQLNIPRPLDFYDTTKMIFPDRTGTGNLRFDNDQLFRVGKILTRPPQSTSSTSTTQSNYDNTDNQNGGNYQYFHQYNTGNPQSGNYNNYNNRQQTTSYQPTRYTTKRPHTYHNNYSSGNQNNQNNYYRPQGYRGEDTSQNIYVTNSKGVIEYYLNARGEKVYT